VATVLYLQQEGLVIVKHNLNETSDLIGFTRDELMTVCITFKFSRLYVESTQKLRQAQGLSIGAETEQYENEVIRLALDLEFQTEGLYRLNRLGDAIDPRQDPASPAA